MRFKLLIGIAAVVVVFAAGAVGCTGAADTGAPAVALTRPAASPEPGQEPTAPPTATPEAVAYSERVDGYLVTAPAMLRAGRTEQVSVSLFQGAEPAPGTVRLRLLRGGSPVAEAGGPVPGSGTIPLAVPTLPQGRYTLHIEATDAAGRRAFADEASVRVMDAPGLLFLETDKPIYKPGQRIRLRALRLDSDLKPLPGPVTVSIQDAKGIKVYQETVETDQFGMAGASLPLSGEPNLGVWKITADAAGQSTQLDARVAEYTLPRYEVSVDLPQEWALAGDPVVGAVSAEYSFGKPVRGTLEIVASRYVGVWEEYARLTKEIDGAASFELPAAGYVAGVPGAGGQGNVQLDVTVREPATGYAERVTRLLTVAEQPVNLQLIPESRVFKPGLPFSLLLVSETPDNRPVSADVSVTVRYVDQEFEIIDDVSHDIATGDGGSALLELSPPEDAVALTVTASSNHAHDSLALAAGYSPSGSFIHVAQAGDAGLSVGERASFRVHSTAEGRNFYYEVGSAGRGSFPPPFPGRRTSPLN